MYLYLPQDKIDQAIEQIKQHHQGKLPTSLIWAAAYDKIAEEIRAQAIKAEVEVAGLTFEVDAH